MESIFALIFLSMQKRIADETTVKHINEDTGQLADEQPAISYPCVLISQQSNSFSNIAGNCQLGTMSIVVKIVFQPHSSAAINTPDKYKQLALGINEVEHQVHQALQGWSPNYVVDAEDVLADVTGSLSRVSSRPDNRRAELRVKEVIYTLGIDDYGTKNFQEYLPAPDMVFEGAIELTL